MKAKEYPTKRELKALFTYSNGKLLWKKKSCDKVVVGMEAGHLHSKGYTVINLGGIYRRARLVWIYFNGNVNRNSVIDHTNRNKNDDRIENLRVTNKQVNAINSGLAKNNKSGVKGVSWCKERKKWVAQLKLNGKSMLHKRYKNKKDAILARKKAEQKYYKPLL